MANDIKSEHVGGTLANMGISELISSLAIGIARGQFELDKACMELASFMGDAEMAFGKRADSNEPDMISLMELGFTPNFYQFTETAIEVKVAISTQFQKQGEMSVKDQGEKAVVNTQTSDSQNEYQSTYGSGSYSGSSEGAGTNKSSMAFRDISVTSVDAKYASSYNYSAESSSVVKTKIAPVPPPQALEEIIQRKLRDRREAQQMFRWKMEAKNTAKTVIERAGTMLGNSAGLAYSGESPTKTKKENISSVIRSSMERLKTDYEGFSLDHWAVIDSIADRESADNAMEIATQNMALLFDEMLLETPEKVFPARVADIKSGITDFKAAIESIYKCLLPEEV